MKELTQDQVWKWIELENDDFRIEDFRRKHNIAPDSSNFSVAIHRFEKERKIKRVSRGCYRKVKTIEPVKWWDVEDKQPLDFCWPVSYIDGSTFGLEDLIEMYEADMILISGVSNFGKTSLTLNILAENLALFKKMPVLMGSEYTAADGKITPKFKKRLDQMAIIRNDAEYWVNGDGSKFKLLPVGADYEDYVEADTSNYIDWISLPGEYYLIDTVMKSIKDRVGNGIGVIVLQKNKASEHGEGGERTARYADVEIKIDPYGEESMLTIGKVKSPKARVSGRSWAFKIQNYGANLAKIREVVRCYKCWGKGWVQGQKCEVCNGLKYIDKGE